MHSKFYRVCCDASLTIHLKNVMPENGFSKEEVAVYSEEGVVNFDKKVSTWEIVFAVIGDDRCWRVRTSVSFFWSLRRHGGLK